MSNGGVPPRWLRCPRKSDGFIGNIFIAFKTPLNSDYNRSVDPQFRFYPSMVKEYAKTRKEKLGLWIDLTKTSRYYQKEEVEDGETTFVKLQCGGHEGPPTQEQTSTFIKICDNFIKQHPLEKIGVHCTHGFNRTGYLICAFFVEMMDWSIHAALVEFARVRPPGIYKQDYIDQLCQNYCYTDDPAPPLVGPLPDWCREDQEYDDDSTLPPQVGFKRKAPADPGNGSSSSNGHVFKRPNALNRDCPTFMEGVQGVEPLRDRNESFRVTRRINELCKYNRTGFIGSQPVSMDVNNIMLLHNAPYMVSWKADGTRYMMFIENKDNIFFIDRDNCVFRVHGITFPYKKNLDDHLFDTLLDGEMIIDTVGDAKYPRYLIYDIVKFRGEDVWKMDFRIRLTCIKDEIYGPREKAKVEGKIKRELEPFGVRHKPFWFLVDTANLIEGKFAQQLTHEPDGCVFQPCRDPYVFGRCDSVLKWKPPNLNTIDFKLKICTMTGEGLIPTRIGELYVGGMNEPFDRMKATKQLLPYDGKIIECKVENGNWAFLRERTDKSFPNAFSTAKAVIASIKNPVTKEGLLEFIASRRYISKPSPAHV